MKTIKKYLALIASVLLISIGIPTAAHAATLPTTPTVTVYAQPSFSLKYMSDGGLFDPIYYKKMYPNVMLSFAQSPKGFCKDEDLYNYYLTTGKALGQLPYMPSKTPIQIFDYTSVKQYGSVVLNMSPVLEHHMLNNKPVTISLKNGIGVMMSGNAVSGIYFFSNCWPVNPTFALFGLPNIGLCGTVTKSYDPIMVGPNFLAEVK